MDALALLIELQHIGATVTVEGGVLWVEPHHVLTDQLRAEIHRLKPDLIQLVGQTKRAQQPEFPVPALLLPQIALLSAPASAGLRDIYEHRGVRSWNWQAVLRMALNTPTPMHLSGVLLDALAQLSAVEMQDFRSRLQDKAWLPHRDGTTAVKPNDVIFLPAIEDELSRLLSNVQFEGAWASPSSLAPGVQEHSAWQSVQSLFPALDDAMTMLGECLTEHGGYGLGGLRPLAQKADDPAALALLLDELLLAYTGAEASLLPAIPVLRAVREGADTRERSVALLPVLNVSLSAPLLPRCLSFLEQRCQEASGAQRRVCEEVHSWYLEALASHPDFEPALLKDLKLRNRRGAWKSTRSLCYGESGFDDGGVLHDQHTQVLRSCLEAARLQSRQAKAKPKSTAQRQRLGGETDVAPRLKKYFAPWRDLVPDECIGGLLALLGGPPNLRRLAKDYLGARDADLIRGQLIGLDSDSAAEVFKNRFYGFLVEVVEGGDKVTRKAPNLLGEVTQFLLSDKFDHLVIGRLGWATGEDKADSRACHIISLLQIDPRSFSRIERLHLLRETAREILDKGFNLPTEATRGQRFKSSIAQ